MVDAKAPAALEGVQAVVPPGELLFRLVEKAEGVGHAVAITWRNAARSGSEKWILPSQRLGLWTSRGSGAMLRSPRMARRGYCSSLRPSLCERGVPAQLVRVLVRSGRFAVRRVEAEDARAAQGCGDDALGSSENPECRAGRLRARRARGSRRRCRPSARRTHCGSRRASISAAGSYGPRSSSPAGTSRPAARRRASRAGAAGAPSAN